MRRSKQLLAAATTALLIGCGAPLAQAGLTNQSFSATLPNLQQPRHVGNQTKTYGSVAGNVFIANVGSTYLVNARMHHAPSGSYGTEVLRLNDGQSARLPNSYGAGTTQLQLTLTNNTWTVVQVSVSGNWRSN